MTAHVRRRSAFADRLREFPDFVFSDGGEFARAGTWREFFAPRIGRTDFDGRLIVEIGCNDAALLARVASTHPCTAFVGIDWKCRALHTAGGRIAAAGLRNVALLHARGQDIPRIFGPGEIDELWLFHPDPCDEPRERANRLFSAPFLISIARVLRRPNSAVILKTDHREYYDSAALLMESDAVSSLFDVTECSTNFWADEALRARAAERCFAGEATSFEERFRRKGKPIHYLELRRR